MSPASRRSSPSSGSVWHAEETARNPGAVVNYDLSGVLDHADLLSWPPDALLAVSSLQRVRFHRPAGAFAAFRADLTTQGVRLRRGGHGIERVPIVRRPARQDDADATSMPERGTFRGLRHVRLDGRRRLCAVHILTDMDPGDAENDSERPDSSEGTIIPFSVRYTNPTLTPRLVDQTDPSSMDHDAEEEDAATRPEELDGDPVPEIDASRSETLVRDTQAEGDAADAPALVSRRGRCVCGMWADWWVLLRVRLIATLLVIRIAWGALWAFWEPSERSTLPKRLICRLSSSGPRHYRLSSFNDHRTIKRRRLHPPIRADPRS